LIGKNCSGVTEECKHSGLCEYLSEQKMARHTIRKMKEKTDKLKEMYKIFQNIFLHMFYLKYK
jgi:hypothetical protein